MLVRLHRATIRSRLAICHTSFRAIGVSTYGVSMALVRNTYSHVIPGMGEGLADAMDDALG